MIILSSISSCSFTFPLQYSFLTFGRYHSRLLLPALSFLFPLFFANRSVLDLYWAAVSIISSTIHLSSLFASPSFGLLFWCIPLLPLSLSSLLCLHFFSFFSFASAYLTYIFCFNFSSSYLLYVVFNFFFTFSLPQISSSVPEDNTFSSVSGYSPSWLFQEQVVRIQVLNL